jgi:hypothetical protein
MAQSGDPGGSFSAVVNGSMFWEKRYRLADTSGPGFDPNAGP